MEAAFKLLKENGFKGVPDEAANGGLVMVGNGANITINVNNGVIGDNNTNVGSNIINSGVNGLKGKCPWMETYPPSQIS